jgi:hypothetical protein
MYYLNVHENPNWRKCFLHVSNLAAIVFYWRNYPLIPHWRESVAQALYASRLVYAQSGQFATDKTLLHLFVNPQSFGTDFVLYRAKACVR